MARKNDNTKKAKNEVTVGKGAKSKANSAKEQPMDGEQKRVADGNEASGKDTTSTIPSKRKAKVNDEPNKVPRRSARGGPQNPNDPLKTLQFLLSPAALDYCRRKDEISDLESRGTDILTYSSSILTPFEELACAVILSRPISYALGLRSIRTLFNAPYNLTTPKALRDAGAEGRRKALDDAKTQHRQKTADELGGLADVVIERIGDGDEDVGLERVRKEAGEDVKKEREILKKNIKGLGNTGLDIFFRRIQSRWKEAYPFVDLRTSGALGKLRLPSDAEKLREVLDEKWKDLDKEDIAGDNGEEKRRTAFIQILERAVGADLEGSTDNMKAEIA
ncbi:MAG: hypothetical protein Q9187_007726, partial [Circinaria calcarea]